jgi:hypothetical protein
VAWVQLVAGVPALLVETGQAGGALGVDGALWIVHADGWSAGRTIHQGISDRSRRADALGVVVGDVTLCAGSAGRLLDHVPAGVYAVSTPAGLVVLAVGVDIALVSCAERVRIAVETRWAFAPGMVPSGGADGVDGARAFHQAGVDAILLVANLVVSTVVVYDALD